MIDDSTNISNESGFRVLIVDDNVGSARILRTLFKKLGHDQVEVAHSGREAIEKAGQFRPDAMVLDLVLGDISGLEVARKIRQDADLSQTLLIALTGKDSPEDRQETSNAGFNLHRVKPFGVEVVKEIISLLQDLQRE